MNTHKTERAVIFDGVLFHTGRYGKLQMAIRWYGEKKDKRDALEVVEAFMSKPLTREWFDTHMEASDLAYTKFIEGEQRGDLLGSATWYGSSTLKNSRGTECILVIGCDT